MSATIIDVPEIDSATAEERAAQYVAQYGAGGSYATGHVASRVDPYSGTATYSVDQRDLVAVDPSAGSAVLGSTEALTHGYYASDTDAIARQAAAMQHVVDTLLAGVVGPAPMAAFDVYAVDYLAEADCSAEQSLVVGSLVTAMYFGAKGIIQARRGDTGGAWDSVEKGERHSWRHMRRSWRISAVFEAVRGPGCGPSESGCEEPKPYAALVAKHRQE